MFVKLEDKDGDITYINLNNVLTIDYKERIERLFIVHSGEYLSFTVDKEHYDLFMQGVERYTLSYYGLKIR